MGNKFRRARVVGLAALIGICVLATAIPAAVADELPVAIRGYDPVAYFTDGKPTRGKPDIEFAWNGLRYYFSRSDHRSLFEIDPERYAPQFGNFCAMALSKGELVEADPDNWLINDGKLYVFGKAAGPRIFQTDLAGNIGRARQNRTLLPKH